MAELMAKMSAQKPLVSVKKGEILRGTITKLTPAEILVDIDGKTEAVVLEKDKRILRNLLSMLHVGDTITVQVLNPESEFGYPVVSLRRYIDDKLWEILQAKQKSHTPLIGVIKEMIRGGALVDTDMGIGGFLPNSQMLQVVQASVETDMSVSEEEQQQESMGKKVDLYILELSRDTHKIIFSQRPVLGQEEFETIVKNVKVGQKMTATIAHVTSFGVFVIVSIEGKTVDGLVHISEISWEKTDTANLGNLGKTIEATVIGIDTEGKRLDLSVKRLTQDPFEERAKAFAVDQKVTGTVMHLTPAGVVVDLHGVEGLMRKEKIPPTVIFEVGNKVTATVSQIDTKRRKIILVPVLLRKTIGYR